MYSSSGTRRGARGRRQLPFQGALEFAKTCFRGIAVPADIVCVDDLQHDALRVGQFEAGPTRASQPSRQGPQNKGSCEADLEFTKSCSSA
jgi:hypothetical protein